MFGSWFDVRPCLRSGLFGRHDLGVSVVVATGGGGGSFGAAPERGASRVRGLEDSTPATQTGGLTITTGWKPVVQRRSIAEGHFQQVGTQRVTEEAQDWRERCGGDGWRGWQLWGGPGRGGIASPGAGRLDPGHAAARTHDYDGLEARRTTKINRRGTFSTGRYAAGYLECRSEIPGHSGCEKGVFHWLCLGAREHARTRTASGAQLPRSPLPGSQHYERFQNPLLDKSAGTPVAVLVRATGFWNGFYGVTVLSTGRNLPA